MSQKALLVTGASSDVGVKIINAIADNYDIIYAHYGYTDSDLLLMKDKYGEKIVLIQDDFRDENSGNNIIKTIHTKEIYPQDIIHLPAPVAESIRFSKVKWDDFENNINISLRSSVNILQPLLKELIKQKKYGKVIIMLTSYTENIPPKFMTPYITTKYALLGLMKALSAEYADKGIMVNGISPGMMETKFLAKTYDHAVEGNAAKSPFGRNLYVDEVIPTVQFLLSDGADRITGQNIVISGGM